jgi:hypothetical protein
MQKREKANERKREKRNEIRFERSVQFPLLLSQSIKTLSKACSFPLYQKAPRGRPWTGPL